MNAPYRPDGVIEMSHGGGGRATHRLISQLFHRHFANPLLDQGHDAARLAAPGGRLAFSTDGHVVAPLRFAGGDIGALAVHGTINDVAMAGAMPIALSAAFIIEEGFALAELDALAASMGAAAREAGVPIATGDTKVVERGKADGLFITTSGIGVIPDGVDIGPHRMAAGQAVLLSGPVGDHGIAILSRRQGLDFGTSLVSDSAPLHRMVADMVRAAPGIAVLRDPTRGGLAATLNELADGARLGIHIEEQAIPVRPEVMGACELLGLDPLTIANEGKLVCLCAEADAEALLAVMRRHGAGAGAARIGRVVAEHPGFVRMTTAIGGSRIVDWLSGEQLPRIC